MLIGDGGALTSFCIDLALLCLLYQSFCVCPDNDVSAVVNDAQLG
jgi:hypothetical protein